MTHTIREILKHSHIVLKNSTTPQLDAQILLCHVLDVERPYLIAHDDRILTDSENAQFQALVARRGQGEPIAYILGKKEFWDLEFIVTPDVLIPRPETEHLIEAALAWAQTKDNFIAADIGTGSGAIAVTIAKHTQSIVHAVDISPDALNIARKNAEKNEVAIHFHEGSLAQPLIDKDVKVDLLMANLPYIATAEMSHLAVSEHEPNLALDGGDDGLDLVRDLLLQVPHVCHPHALILLEIGMEQGQAVLDFAQDKLAPQSATLIKDLAGLDRIVKIEL